MTDLGAAVQEIVSFLESRSVPYMIIGGFANLHWGRPRLTQDIDVTVSVPDAQWQEFINAAGAAFRLLAPEPLEFARRTRVIPACTQGGIPVDIVLAGISYEEAAIRRAVSVDVEGMAVRLCTAEDLVLHKLASDRPRDLEDAEGVVLRQGAALDRAYLAPLVTDLAEVLERPSILVQYREALAKAGLEL